MKTKNILIIESIAAAALLLFAIFSIIAVLRGSILHVVLGAITATAGCALMDDSLRLYRYLRFRNRNKVS